MRSVCPPASHGPSPPWCPRHHRLWKEALLLLQTAGSALGSPLLRAVGSRGLKKAPVKGLLSVRPRGFECSGISLLPSSRKCGPQTRSTAGPESLSDMQNPRPLSRSTDIRTCSLTALEISVHTSWGEVVQPHSACFWSLPAGLGSPCHSGNRLENTPFGLLFLPLPHHVCTPLSFQ